MINLALRALHLLFVDRAIKQGNGLLLLATFRCRCGLLLSSGSSMAVLINYQTELSSSPEAVVIFNCR